MFSQSFLGVLLMHFLRNCQTRQRPDTDLDQGLGLRFGFRLRVLAFSV